LVWLGPEVLDQNPEIVVPEKKADFQKALPDNLFVTLVP
jgi:hypothetical protein